MAVNLSPVYGAGAQLFDNNGFPLAGGFIYTYLAGTSTPASTYTSSTGNIQHSNPIILDASGRVPGGEIWLTTQISYKFVIEDSSSVLIGTYDNINSINNVESVSVADFGAVGDGITDDTAAIQNALNYISSNGGGTVYLVQGKRYLIDSANLVILPRCGLDGRLALGGTEKNYGSNIKDFSNLPTCLVINPSYTIQIQDSGFIRGMNIARKGITDSSVSLRAGLDNVKAYSGTAITIVGDDACVEEVFIIGFTTAYSAAQVQRCIVFNVKGDNTNQFYFNNIPDTAKVLNTHSWNFMTGNQSYTLTNFTVNSVTSGTGGVCRLSLATTTPFVTGDLVNISTGDSNGNGYGICNRWTITVIDSQTIELQGSIYGTTTVPSQTLYTYPSLVWTRGIWGYVTGNSQVNFIDCSSFGWTNGLILETSVQGSPGWVQLSATSFDNYAVAKDPTTVGISISGASFATTFLGGNITSYASNAILNCTPTTTTPTVFCGTDFSEANTGGNALTITSGRALFSSCSFRTGSLYIGNNATRIYFAGCDLGSCTFSYQTSTNIQNVNVDGFTPAGIPQAALTNNNIAWGVNANANNTNSNGNIVALGTGALSVNQAANMVAVGRNAMLSNTTGNSNTAVGFLTLQNNTTGGGNSAFGNQALEANLTTNSNTAIGNLALYTQTALVGCTALGANTSLPSSCGNSTVIGQGATGTTDNEFTLGNSSIATLRCAVTSITAISDERDKKNIVSLDAGLEFVNNLKPVRFDWNMRDGGKVDVPSIGFIAQDLKQVQKDINLVIPDLVYEANPERLEASYGVLIPVLVKAIQELKAEIDSLKSGV